MKKNKSVIVWIVILLLCLCYSIIYRILVSTNIFTDILNMITMILSSFSLGMWTRESFK